VAERVEDPAEPPTVLVDDGRRLLRACGYRVADEGVRFLDDKQGPARRAAECARAEPLHLV